MRIFFCGAQGTGKSTLVHKLKDEISSLSSYTVHDSMSAKFMKSKGDQLTIDTKDGLDFQRKISLYCLNLYVNERDIICSRSYFDSVAYPIYKDNSTNNFLVQMVREYKSLCFEDDCIYFYLPIEFDITNDGNNLRIIDLEYQKAIDRIIQEEIELLPTEFRNKIYTITGTIDERMNTIRSIIEK